MATVAKGGLLMVSSKPTTWQKQKKNTKCCVAPYQVIHVGAAAPSIPDALVDQLAAPGRMFIPVGVVEQGECGGVAANSDRCEAGPHWGMLLSAPCRCFSQMTPCRHWAADADAVDIWQVDKDASGAVIRKKLFGVMVRCVGVPFPTNACQYVPLTDKEKQWTE